jgi:hypothetical protein
MFEPRIRSLIVGLAVVLAWTSGCRSHASKAIAPPDSYLLFVPRGEGSQAGMPLPVRRAAVDDPAVQPLPGLLETGFASEMLRTVYLAGQFLRDAVVDGKRFSDLGRANGSLPVCIVVGTDKMPYARGLSIQGFLGSDNRPSLPWIGIPAAPGRDKALLQTLAAHFSAYAANLIASGGLLDLGPPPPKVLVDGYRMAMEVVAREWRTTAGPAGVIQTDEGTAAQRALFGEIRDNRYILDTSHEHLRPAKELLESAGVAATIIYRMAQSHAVGTKVAPEAFYAPFAANRMPPGVSPAAILGTFRNFQAKLLGAWGTAVLRGNAPKDIADLVKVYGAAFPTERWEVLRIFVVTTYGATVKPGGSSMDPKDAQHTQAELTALAAQVAVGKRTLRDALAGQGD